MYMHIGNNQMIRLETIIAIVDLKTIQANSGVNHHEKSIIITDKDVFYSSISSVTLLERTKVPLTKTN